MEKRRKCISISIFIYCPLLSHYTPGLTMKLWHNNDYTADSNVSVPSRFTEDRQIRKNSAVFIFASVPCLALSDQRRPRMSIIGRAWPDINWPIKGYCYATILSQSWSALIWFLNPCPCLFCIEFDHNSCLFFVLKRHKTFHSCQNLDVP